MKPKKKPPQRERAQQAGISLEFYNSVIKHRRRPSVEVAKEIARIEGCHPMHLLDPAGFDERGKKRRPAEPPAETTP